jgi:hypothetical protein
VTSVPAVTTHAATGISIDSAKVAATITNEGTSSVIQRGFCWAKVPSPTIANNFITKGLGIGNLNHTITGLESNTIYFVRAYAMNGSGIAYGNEIAFKTKRDIGDPGPAGGVVFYVDGMGGGIEVAPASTDTAAMWGCIGGFVTGTSIAVGFGQPNTTAILNFCTQSNVAAAICNNLVFNGYDDWFLPSLDELFLVYTNVVVPGLDTFQPIRYWSSSEFSASEAWRVNLGVGVQVNGLKNETWRVRAVRKF